MRRRLHSLGLIGVTPLVALAAVPGCRDAATQTRPTAFDQTLVGTVLRYQDRAPVSGATVSFGSSSAVTNQAGRFQLVGVPGSGAVRLTAAAQGYLERATWVEIRESNGPVSFDMVHDSAPFSLGYYREFARNAHERPDQVSSAGLLRWTMAPSFFFKTTLEDSPTEVPDEVVDAIIHSYRVSVPQLSGGTYEVAAVERGPETRPAALGWVNVLFYRDLRSATGIAAVGSATVGGDSGVIRLTYDPARSANPPCQYPALEIANHEIVHTMGFRHTDLSWFDDPWAENTVRTIDCMGTRAELVRYHAAVAYSRPRLNMDQDQDPVRLTAMAQTTSRQAKAGPETFCPIPTGER